MLGVTEFNGGSKIGQELVPVLPDVALGFEDEGGAGGLKMPRGIVGVVSTLTRGVEAD